MISERPFADGRHTAVFVFNELRTDGGRLTQLWLARLRAFDAAGWATHAALINKDVRLDRTVRSLIKRGLLPAGTAVHHYAMRDRRIRPSWWGPLAPGETIDPRVGDWLDWLTGQIPGAVVFADSPAAYPYLAHMTNPLVARVAGIHLNHLSAKSRPGTAASGSAVSAGTAPDGDPAMGPLATRFAQRFAPCQQEFDALVVMTAAQAGDLRTRFGSDTPLVVIPPAVAHAGPSETAGAVGPSRRLVSVGPLEEASGHADAIHAVHSLTQSHQDLSLDLVGEGELGDQLLALADSLGLAGRVRVIAPGSDEDAAFAGARLTIWAGQRESTPLSIVRSLGQGVPVLARDVRYGPAELITAPELGVLVPDDGQSWGPALAQALSVAHDPAEVRAAAGALLRRTDPKAVGSRWVGLAARLADDVCDHRQPSLLVESVATTTRVLKLPGVLADSASPLSSWSCELPGLVEPAGWLSEPPRPPGVDPVEDDEDAPVHPHAAGPTREVVVQLRSNALAFVVTETAQAFRIEFTDGSSRAPLLTTAFTERIIASRVGNATLHRQPDGSVWVTPRPELLFATNVDGRLLVRADPDDAPSDVTHALDWVVDIDWMDLRPTPRGGAFRGTLRATGIAPADDSPPAICVTDVGGFSRAVGLLHYTAEPQVEGLAWSAPVDGVLESEPLARTTELARSALALHVGYRGLLVPIGGLWTHGRRAPIHLTSGSGEVTLLPSPGGRVLAAPGKGYRARVSGALRSAVGLAERRG